MFSQTYPWTKWWVCGQWIDRYITSLIAMGRISLVCFCKVNIHDARNKHDTNEGTWPWAMRSHISKNKLKSFIESFGKKQSCKSSYTIFEKSPNEKHGEHAKTKIKSIPI